MDSKILNLETVLYLTQRRLPEKLSWLYQEVAYKGHLQTWYTAQKNAILTKMETPSFPISESL